VTEIPVFHRCGTIERPRSAAPPRRRSQQSVINEIGRLISAGLPRTLDEYQFVLAAERVEGSAHGGPEIRSSIAPGHRRQIVTDLPIHHNLRAGVGFGFQQHRIHSEHRWFLAGGDGLKPLGHTNLTTVDHPTLFDMFCALKGVSVDALGERTNDTVR